jgi:hypothetical protein
MDALSDKRYLDNALVMLSQVKEFGLDDYSRSTLGDIIHDSKRAIEHSTLLLEELERTGADTVAELLAREDAG